MISRDFIAPSPVPQGKRPDQACNSAGLFQERAATFRYKADSFTSKGKLQQLMNQTSSLCHYIKKGMVLTNANITFPIPF